MNLKIYVFGSSIVSAYWNGAATYYRGVFRGLAALGHEIHFCEPDIYDRQKHRDLADDPEYVRVRVYRTAAELRDLQAEAEAADVVIKCSGIGARDTELEEWVAAVDGPLRAFWDVDAADTLDRVERDPRDPMRACIPSYDLVFTYGGGPPVVERYLALGARTCRPVYNGVDPDIHRPASLEPDLACDAVFMGNRLPDREERVERFFLEVAEHHPRRRFLLGGSGWDRKPLPFNVRWIGHVPTSRHNALNASARLVINIHRPAMAGNGYSPATRMFEAAGSAACQVTDAWEGIERFFQPDREILVAESPERIGHYIETIGREKAVEIGRAARARALRDHSYQSRAAGVHRVLEEAYANEAVPAGAGSSGAEIVEAGSSRGESTDAA